MDSGVIKAMELMEKIEASGRGESTISSQDVNEDTVVRQEVGEMTPEEEEYYGLSEELIQPVNNRKPKKEKAEKKEKTEKKEKGEAKPRKKSTSVELPKKAREMGIREEFKNLPKSIGIKVSFSNHDIHYKEQFWNIPTRDVEYNVELMLNPALARQACIDINKADLAEEVYDGKLMMYRVITYENVLSKAKQIAYIMVSADSSGKISVHQYTSATKLKELHVATERFKKEMSRICNDILKVNNKQ